MATSKVILEKRTTKKDGTHALKVQLIHRRVPIYLNLDLSVKENQFDGLVVIDHPKAVKWNRIIKSKLLQVEFLILQLQESGRINRISPAELKQVLINNDTEASGQKEYTVEDHFLKYAEKCKTSGTRGLYIATRDKIRNFAPGITFQEVNKSWLESFDADLAKTCRINTRSIHMRNLRAVFNDAISRDMVDGKIYPFRRGKFKIEEEETFKRSTTIEVIQNIRDKPVRKLHESYRDYFMFQFYTMGINIIDMVYLRHEDVRNGRIEYTRRKTGSLHSIEIVPEIQAILDKYKGEDYLLQIMDHHNSHKVFAKKLNHALDTIGFAGLTTYWARHTWATTAADLEIPIETISLCLGHKLGLPTTLIYTKFNQKKIDEANRRVLAAIKTPVVVAEMDEFSYCI